MVEIKNFLILGATGMLLACGAGIAADSTPRDPAAAKSVVKVADKISATLKVAGAAPCASCDEAQLARKKALLDTSLIQRKAAVEQLVAEIDAAKKLFVPGALSSTLVDHWSKLLVQFDNELKSTALNNRTDPEQIKQGIAAIQSIQSRIRNWRNTAITSKPIARPMWKTPQFLGPDGGADYDIPLSDTDTLKKKIQGLLEPMGNCTDTNC